MFANFIESNNKKNLKMKTTILIAIAFIFSTNSQSQNVNVKEVTKTTTTTIKNSDGDKTYTKKENLNETQNIELKDVPPNTLNTEMKTSPIQGTSVTQIINPDGSSRVIDIDRSSYYESNGVKYKITTDNLGYTISEGNKKPSLLRKTATDNYLYYSRNKTSIGHFDSKGNLILETYNKKTDQITTETYVIIKK